MYLYVLNVLMGAAYLALLQFFPLFFQQPRPLAKKDHVYKFAAVLVITGLFFWTSELITNIWWSNRFLHAFGGGFVAMFVCALAARDSGVRMTLLQWCTLSVLIVIALGVGNELVEFMLETTTSTVYAPTTTDTWLDLASNLVGIGSALVLVIPRSNYFRLLK